MGGIDLRAGRQLGTQSVEVDDMTVIPLVMIDALPGGVIPGPFTHHLRVVSPAKRHAYLLPCDARYLRVLAEQLAAVADAADNLHVI